jgi:hypothetical protein
VHVSSTRIHDCLSAEATWIVCIFNVLQTNESACVRNDSLDPQKGAERLLQVAGKTTAVKAKGEQSIGEKVEHGGEAIFLQPLSWSR